MNSAENDTAAIEDSGPTDLVNFSRAIDTPVARSWALTGLLILAVLAALFVARDVVMPIIMAFMLSLVFTPVVRLLAKAHIPEALSAGLVVLTLVGTLGAGVYYLSDPAEDWLNKAPKTMRELSKKLRHLSQPVQRVSDASEQVAQMTTVISGDAASGAPAHVVTMKTPTAMESLLDAAQGFLIALVSVLVLFYYFLASGNLFLRKVIAVTPKLTDRKRAVDISRQIESEVSGYLFTVALINTGLGCAVGLAMWGLGVPNPALWGVMVGLFNFIPYLGDFASFAVLTMVGLLSFDEIGRALLVPATFYLLTAAEGYLITPHLLGRRLRLSPVAIVISVLFWGWMWGLFGALLAVPILVATKTFCDRVESLKAFGEFLGD